MNLAVRSISSAVLLRLHIPHAMEANSTNTALYTFRTLLVSTQQCVHIAEIWRRLQALVALLPRKRLLFRNR